MGGRKVYGWGEKNGLLRAGWEKEKRGKENKTKQKKSWPAARGWVGEKEKREKKKKKKRPAASYLAGWEKEKREREKKKKKKKSLLRTSWLGGRKKREREKKKKSLLCTWLGGRKKREGRKKKKNKNPMVTFQKVKRYQWSPKIKNKKF
jgi:hypothetical protein